MRFFLVFLAIFFLAVPFTFVDAHTLEIDGSIGAVLHIDPADEPYAGSPAYFFFEFKDTAGKFAPANCRCVVTILEGGKELYTASLAQDGTTPSLSSASFSYTFPQKDVYQLKLTGTPVSTTNPFQSFTLLYDIRVDRVAPPPSPTASSSSVQSFLGTHALHLGLTLLGAGIVAFSIWREGRKS